LNLIRGDPSIAVTDLTEMLGWFNEEDRQMHDPLEEEAV